MLAEFVPTSTVPGSLKRPANRTGPPATVSVNWFRLLWFALVAPKSTCSLVRFPALSYPYLVRCIVERDFNLPRFNRKWKTPLSPHLEAQFDCFRDILQRFLLCLSLADATRN